MSNKLKNCPFCGSTVQLNANMGNPKYPHYFVTCHGCAAAVSFGIPPQPDAAVMENKVITAWNTRKERSRDCNET